MKRAVLSLACIVFVLGCSGTEKDEDPTTQTLTKLQVEPAETAAAPTAASAIETTIPTTTSLPAPVETTTTTTMTLDDTEAEEPAQSGFRVRESTWPLREDLNGPAPSSEAPGVAVGDILDVQSVALYVMTLEMNPPAYVWAKVETLSGDSGYIPSHSLAVDKPLPGTWDDPDYASILELKPDSSLGGGGSIETLEAAAKDVNLFHAHLGRLGEDHPDLAVATLAFYRLMQVATTEFSRIVFAWRYGTPPPEFPIEDATETLRWAQNHSEHLQFFELGALLGLNREPVLKTADELADRTGGDDLAWFASQLIMGGECEGYLPCTLRVLGGRDLWYLERFPEGKHAQNSLEQLTVFFENYRDLDSFNEETTLIPEGSPDWIEVQVELADISAILANVPGSEDVIRLIREIQDRVAEQIPPESMDEEE